MPENKQFFKMSFGDKLTIIILLIYPIIAFLFFATDITIAGMSFFGWLIGFLMLLAPVVGFVGMYITESNKENGS